MGLALLHNWCCSSQKTYSDVHDFLPTKMTWWHVKVDYHGEIIVKIPPFLENLRRSPFKALPFLLKSMDHASNRKVPSFSMQMRTSVRSTFGLDCRVRGMIPKTHNLCTFWPVIRPINHLFKSNKKPSCPTLHRCKKCSEIFKVASVGGLHFLHLWNIGQKGLLSDFEGEL